MPKYLVRVTRTETVTSVVERVVDIPTEHMESAATYIEVAVAHGQYDDRNPLRYEAWKESATRETFTCEILSKDPALEDPDFSEVEPEPAHFTLPVPTV